MKKKINQILSLLLAAAMVLSLSACGEKVVEKNPDETPPGYTTHAETTAATEPEHIPYTPDESLSAARITIEGTKFMVNGKELWLNGVNTPWHKWNDFQQNFDEEWWDNHFKELHEAGVNASRVWINCNGGSAVKLNTELEVRSLPKAHWEAVDKLFRIAEKHEIYLMPTLMSFDHFKDTGPQYELWRKLIADEAASDAYIETYVVEFAKRYGDSPYLLGIDLCNEPDWIIENEECGRIPAETVMKFFAKCAAAVHENSNAYVTIGMGMIKYNSDGHQGNLCSDERWKGYAGENAYVDFYSPHYYEWQKQWMGYPFDKSPEKFGLDGTRPMIIGESSAFGSDGKTLKEQYIGAYDNGWNGVMAWNSDKAGGDNDSDLDDIREASTHMAEYAKEKVFPLN